jgi:hypothetical protein
MLTLARSLHLVLILILTLPAHAQERSREINLRPKFEAGQRIKYKLELANSSRPDSPRPSPQPHQPAPVRPGQPTPLQPQTTQSNVEMGLTLQVAEVSAEGIATVKMIFDSLKVATRSDDISVEFDSTKPAAGEDDIAAMLLKSIVGTALTMKVDRNGNISSVTGGEAFMALGQFTSGSSSAEQLFGPIFSGNPAKGSAKIGESWEYADRLSSGLLGDFKMVTKHTLRGLQGSNAQIAITGRIEPTSESPGSSSYQVKNSTYTGNYLWDTTKGQLARMETSMNVQIEDKAGHEKTNTRNESTVKITRLQ